MELSCTGYIIITIIVFIPNYMVPDLQTAVVKTAIGRLQNLLGVVAP